MVFKQLCFEVYDWNFFYIILSLGLCIAGFYFYFLYSPDTHGGALILSMAFFIPQFINWFVYLGLRLWAYPKIPFYDDRMKRKKMAIDFEFVYYILSLFFIGFMFWYSSQSKIGFLVIGIVSLCNILIGFSIVSIRLIPFQLFEVQPVENKKIRIIGAVATTILIFFSVFCFVYVGKAMFAQKEVNEFLESHPYDMVDEKNDYVITDEKNIKELSLLIIDKYFENRKDAIEDYFISNCKMYENDEVEDLYMLHSYICIERKAFTNYWGDFQDIGPYIRESIDMEVKKVSENRYEIQSINKNWW